MKRYSVTNFALGLGTGVVAGLLFDPVSGPRRRAYMRHKAAHTMRALNRWSIKAQRMWHNRLAGFYHDVAMASEGYVEVDDVTLEQRVRSQLGHSTDYTHSVTVDVASGVVVLTGAVPRGEIDDIVDCVESVKGVRDVVNKLQVSKTPELVADLPG